MKKSIFFLTVSTLLFSGVANADQNYGCSRDATNGRQVREEGYYRGQQQDPRNRGRDWNRENARYRDRDEQRDSDNNSAYRGNRNDRDNSRDYEGDNDRSYSREDFMPRWDERRDGRRFAKDRLDNLPESVDVTINVSRGVVTLTGTVDNERERQEVKERVRRLLEGAKNVQDKLQVTNKDNSDKQANNRSNRSKNAELADASDNAAYSSPEMDGQVMLNIQNALKGGMLSKGYDRVTFDVSNGNVVLRGAVDSEDDRQAIMKKVAEIKGVKKIDNQVKVQLATKASSY